MNNKVISASAGSGKTYRLALEYIAILIKNINNSDFHFERILVITFTRKAAAEIRNKIFEMLDDVILHNKRDVIMQLQDLSKVNIDEELIIKLQALTVMIKTQKDKLRISTIDSLINQVFKSMIAPLMKLNHYTIEENANKNIWEDIFDELVKEKNIDSLRNIIEANPQKNVETIGKVFGKLIDERWVLYFLEKNGKLFRSIFTDDYLDIQTVKLEAEKAYNDFVNAFIDYCKNINRLILQKLKDKPKDTFEKYFKKDFLLFISRCKSFDINQLESKFLDIIKDFIDNNLLSLDKNTISLFVKNSEPYSKTKLKDCEEILNTHKLLNLFNNLVYYFYIIPESLNIIEIWNIILDKYDDLKQKNPILTYNDITWFTFFYLYNPEFSMIDSKDFIVENQFYEFLSVRNQYLLIDEFQDTSFMQFMILAPMINDLKSGNSIFQDTNIIIVGDEKQSIYGWRGGQKGLLSFMNCFLNTQSDSLNTCYRSVPQIIDFVNYIFNEGNFTEFNLSNPKFLTENWSYNANIVSGKANENGLVKNIFFDKEQTDEDNHSENPYYFFIENVVIPNIKDCNELNKFAIIARENKHLESIAEVLTENGIPFVRESSQTFLNHPVIKAILYLLKFIQYNDYNALLCFLRSDVVLFDTISLKEIALKITNYESDDKSFFLDCYQNVNADYSSVIMSKIHRIYYNYHKNKEIDVLFVNPLTVCNDIIKDFDLMEIFKSENDVKNIHNFLNIVSAFIINPGDYLLNIDGFLQYCQDIEHKKQLSMNLDNAINLLTIHKSKGLGFDTVFLYIDVHTKKDTNQSIKIDYLIDTNTYSDLSDCLISLNYKKELTQLFPDTFDLIKHKQKIEELNNLYVAFTRAKYNLLNFWIYDEKTLKEETVKNKLLSICFNYEKQDLTQMKINNKHCKDINTTQTTSFNYNVVKEYLDINNSNLKMQIQNESETILEEKKDFQHYKKHFFEKKSRTIGNAAHMYLSFIKYNTEKERYLAKLQVIRIYGALLRLNELDSLIERVVNFMQTRSDLFSKKWDKVFNEYSVIDKNKKLYRIDRMMIDTKNNEICIIDYKTGNIDDVNQVDLYIKLISNMPEFIQQKYTISGEFVSV